MRDGPGVTPELVDQLLALPTRAGKVNLLRNGELLDADGLDRLLDFAEQLAGGDPRRAQRLVEICVDLSDEARASAALPRTNYLRAQTHAIDGEFDSALQMVKVAHDGYVAIGEDLEALRTNVGLMVVLLELGRYQESLEAGRVVTEALNSKSETGIDFSHRERDLLVALVHQNRGRCLEYMGRYEEALDAYEIAESRYKTLGMNERLGEIIDNRGAIFSTLGRGIEALEAHESAASIFNSSGLDLAYTKALVNAGEAHLRLGNYTGSLEAFEQARRPLDSLGELADKYLLLRHTADAYLELNLYTEALAVYEEAVGLLRGSGMAHDLAQALWGKGSVLVAMSELEEAEKALAEAADLFLAADNKPLLSGVMLEQASLQAASEGRETALATAARALALVSGNDWPAQLVYVHLSLADLLLPDLASAERHLVAAGRLVERLSLPQLRYRLNERLGRLRRLQGRDEEALVLLEAAVEEVERLRGTVYQEPIRASFLVDKIVAYEELLQLYLAQESEESARQAFRVAERAKSRALVDLLNGVVGAKAASEDTDSGARLNELQADLNATYNQMLRGPVDGENKALLPELRNRANELEREISRLRLQDAATGAPSDVFTNPLLLENAEEQAPYDVVLLAYHIVGDEILAFIDSGERLRIVRRVGSVTKVRQLLRRLTIQWDRFHLGGDFAGKHVTLLERSARQVLAALYAELVAPLEPLLEEAERAHGDAGSVPRLAVVPHGPLHQVPFHALFGGDRYLIERFEISYAPSATVFTLCQERSSGDSDRALVFGVEDPLVPATVAEAHAVAEHLPGAKVRVGEKATLAALRDEPGGCGVLHLASHGLFRADNPMFSALKMHDGWLMATDIMELDLTGTIVALSACESGLSSVIGGDETLGLIRAFLGAGAATLVVSLWIVQDETTAALMGNWYGLMHGGMEPAAALREAQLEIKEEFPHPFYWAPFILVGRR